jgi:hypothetical protein
MVTSFKGVGQERMELLLLHPFMRIKELLNFVRRYNSVTIVYGLG